MEFSAGGGSLPDGALVELAVAEDGVYPRLCAVQPQTQRHALSCSKADAQRSGGEIHAGCMRRGMPLQRAAELTQGVKRFRGDKALFNEVSVQHGRGVTLAKHKAVALRIVWRRYVHAVLV